MKNSKEYLDKVVNIIEIPYFYELGLYGITDLDEQKYIFNKIYVFDIRIINKTIRDSKGNNIYIEEGSSGEEWFRYKRNKNGNVLYYEDSDGDWYKREYDSRDNEIYYEDSTGDWERWEYNSDGNVIYGVDSKCGILLDNRNI